MKLRRAHTPSALLESLEPRQLLVFNPTADEQYMLELLNRMRTNPAAELALLTSSLGNPAHSNDPDVNSALNYFKTKGSVLASQWASLVAAPPLAWSDKLYNSAEGHNTAMIAGDVQSHQVTSVGELDLGGRADAAGYTSWSNLGENIYAFAKSVIHAHAGFAIDWGGDPTDPATTGIQNPPGHRDDMMDPAFREVGIRIAYPGIVAGHDVGPWVVTQDFGKRFNQGNPFLLGTAYNDSSNDAFYTPGEGLGGVTVTAVAGNGAGASFVTSTMSAGGWQLQVPAGTYSVTFAGGSFGSSVTYYNIAVGSANVKLDAVKGVAPPAPIIQIYSNDILIPTGDTTPVRADNTDLGNANLTAQSNSCTYTVYNPGNLALTLSGNPRVVISGANASDFTLIMDAGTTVASGGGRSMFTIVFDPSALGLRVAQVTIASSDPATPSYTFKIQGRGVQRPIAQVSGNHVNIDNADTSPTTADWSKFAGIDAQYMTKVRIFTITNTGLATLTFPGATPVTLSGPNADRFSVFVQPAASIAPGQSTQFRVRFTPGGQVGFSNALISIASNDAVTPVYTFAIQGNGLALPRASITSVVSGASVPIATGDGSPSPTDNTDFGSVVTSGTANRVRLFTITNIGLAAMVLTGISRVTITGPNASDFFVSAQPTLTTLAPGQSVTFKVRFDPLATGIRSATVTLDTNENPNLSPSQGHYNFTIAGVGT
jgi:uncharacterized protein YkwD